MELRPDVDSAANHVIDGDFLVYHGNNETFTITYDPSQYISYDVILQEIRQSFYMYKRTGTLVLISLYALMIMVGLVGNFLVIYVFARNRKMQTVTNSFLVNLAVCDLMVVVICMPFSVATETYTNWIYGDALCKIVNFCQGISLVASVLTLAVISAERFYAIRRPLRARAFMSRKRISSIITTVWFLSGIAVMPLLIVRTTTTDHLLQFDIGSCVEVWKVKGLKHSYNFTLLVLLYICPVVFICVGYLNIGMNLWRTNLRLHASSDAAESENARSNLNGRRRVARMLFVMAILFAISWLPYHVMSILLDFLTLDGNSGQNSLLFKYLHSYSLWMGHANSSLNPICYCIMSSRFKSALRLELHRCCCCCSRHLTMTAESFMAINMSVSLTTSNTTFSSKPSPNFRASYAPVSTGGAPGGLMRNSSISLCRQGAFRQRPEDV